MTTNHDYQELLRHVGDALEDGRSRAAAAVNTAVVMTYWDIWRQIVEYDRAVAKRQCTGPSF